MQRDKNVLKKKCRYEKFAEKNNHSQKFRVIAIQADIFPKMPKQKVNNTVKQYNGNNARDLVCKHSKVNNEKNNT